MSDGPTAALTAGFSAFDLSGATMLAAAVSGGSDSTALLLLLRDHLARHHHGVGLIALTVDHGLRPGSADEAQAVATLCARIGVSHRILAWTGPKPRTGVAEAARLARHILLAEAAETAGARAVMTGHTADDQAETVAMRSQRGAGPGLAGMAPATLFDNRIWFLRPLIDHRRASLRAFLGERRTGWIDDPTNEDPDRERARIRQMLAVRGDTDDFVDAARAAADERRRASSRIAALLDAHGRLAAPGLARLDPALFSAGDDAAEALRLVAACFGGLLRLPEPRRARMLAAVIASLGDGRVRATYGRCVIDAPAKGVFLHREWRDGGPKAIAADAGALFDGRFRVVDGAPAGQVAATGPAAAAGGGRLARAAARAEPVVLGSAANVVVVRRIISPYALFLPEFDHAAATAAARLLGAEAPPPAPWRGHNAAIGS